MKINIKPRQEQIFILIYRFRFLNRKQIQNIIGHKHHRQIQAWLNELIKNKYIIRYYNQKLAPISAVYSLGSEGRKHFKENQNYNIKTLSRVWREAKYSMEFKEHCQFCATIYQSLLILSKDNKLKLSYYSKVDLFDFDHLISPLPDAYFALEDEEGRTKRYFLDAFDDLPPALMRKRVKQYFDYYNSESWQENTDKPFPDIILVFPNNRLKSHIFFYIQNKLSDDEPRFYLTTKAQVMTNGLNSDALQRVNEPE